ncbi:TPA: hypothetical protein ACJ5AR_001439, partial [Klebsiella aerogenes]
MRKPEYCINSHYCAIFSGPEVLLSTECGSVLDKTRCKKQKERPAAAQADRRAVLSLDALPQPRYQRITRRQVYAGDDGAAVYRP